MGKINGSWYSSNTDEWATPQKVFDELNDEFGFTLDPCASAVNRKTESYYDKDADGLSHDWGGANCALQSSFQ